MMSADQYSEIWNDKPLTELMDHIVAVHHAFCRREIAGLTSLFKQIATGYGKDHPELKKMEALFGKMAKDLKMHLVKEEETLFPYIARLEQAVQQNAAVSWPAFGTVENPIRMMVLEHDQTGQELSQVRRLGNGYTAPHGAPESVVALYDGLRAFELDMTEHTRVENQLLFPRAIPMEEQVCTRTKPV